MRIISLVLVTALVGCVDVSNICPHKPITQGVFGEIVDSTGANEVGVEVDAYTVLDGMQDTMIGSDTTTRGGYELSVLPSSAYMVCAKSSCATVAVPTGLVELSGDDAAAGFTWDMPAAVPPDQTIGPCTFGD